MFLLYIYFLMFSVFFFSSRRRHTRLVSDWSSDVCSSDLCRSSSRRAPSGVAAIKDLARQQPRAYMPGVRLFHRKACEYLAKHLPRDARRLFRRTTVSWHTIQRLTASALDGWSRQDEARETARKSGLLSR